MGVWLATHCVWVSATTAANSHSLHRTGGQWRGVWLQHGEKDCVYTQQRAEGKQQRRKDEGRSGDAHRRE